MANRPRRQGVRHGPPEFHSLRIPGQPGSVFETSKLCDDLLKEPQNSPGSPTHLPIQLATSPNHHSAIQATNVLQGPSDTPNDNAAIPTEQPAPNLPNRLSNLLVDNNIASGCNSQPKTSSEASQASTAAGQQLILRMQSRTSDPDSPNLPNIQTQRFADPTQPFLALDLDLNETADKELYMSPEPRGVNDSPPANAVHRSRSRSPSRSPSRGKANSTSLRRKSSPKHIFRTLRASPGTGSHQLV